MTNFNLILQIFTPLCPVLFRYFCMQMIMKREDLPNQGILLPIIHNHTPSSLNHKTG